MTDILRYRFHYGTNVGSFFVLEKWLFSSMFPSKAGDKQSSELESLKLWIPQIGIDATRAKFEAHWASALTDDDLDWLVNTARVNTIRLPIGFFTLGPSFCADTAFANYGAVYRNAWSFVRKTVKKARDRGIGVLLDMHGLPGGANDGDHSGTNSGKIELWGNATNLAKAKAALEFVVREAKTVDGVVGVQVVNEAAWQASGLYDWYNSLLSSFARIDDSIPIYISDAWNLDKTISYVSSKNRLGSNTNPVVIDTHYYWAFTDSDKSKSVQQIIAEIPGKLRELDGHDGNVFDRGAVSAIVGEYSCALDGATWNKSGPAGNRDKLTKDFGQAQSARYQSRSSGTFFWTLKMDWMPGGDWGFKAQTQSGAVTPPAYMRLSAADVRSRAQKASSEKAARLKSSYDTHVAYWNSAEPNKKFEHRKFHSGWQVGFEDALAFFRMRSSGKLGGGGGSDKIGLLDLWVKKRIRDGDLRGDFVWEFETGLRKGVEDFGKLSGAY